MNESIDEWNGGASALGRELLASGRSERASATTRRRAERALLSGLGAAASSGATTLAGSVLRAALKGFFLAAVAVGGGEVVRRNLHHDGGRAVGAAAKVLSTSSAPAVSVEAHAPAEPEPPVARFPETVASVAPRNAEMGRGVRPKPPASSQRADSNDGRLAREVAALRQARAELVRGAPERALQILDGATGGFSMLGFEASVLRAEAMARGGRRSEARSLAREVLRQHPEEGPYVERLRALAEP